MNDHSKKFEDSVKSSIKKLESNFKKTELKTSKQNYESRKTLEAHTKDLEEKTAKVSKLESDCHKHKKKIKDLYEKVGSLDETRETKEVVAHIQSQMDAFSEIKSIDDLQNKFIPKV